ncbi:MAG: hypothetical protein ACR2PM_14065 [Hyphomicrobiales bacterium]
MADNTPVVHDFEPHKESYSAFIHLTLATMMAVGFILVALIAAGLAQNYSLLTAVAGLIVGLGAVTLTMMTGGRNWIPCGVLLAAYFLLTATLL